MKIPLPKFHPNDKVMCIMGDVIIFTTIKRAVYSKLNPVWNYVLQDYGYTDITDEHLVLINNCHDGLVVDIDPSPIR